MTMVEMEKTLLAQWRALPPEEQQEMLEYAEFLRKKTPTQRPRRSLLGLCADLNVTITEEDIAEARKEMWGNFPTFR